jgi:hypothetical protein
MMMIYNGFEMKSPWSIQVLCRHLFKFYEENHEKSVRITDVLAVFRIRYLQNMGIQLQHQTIVLGPATLYGDNPRVLIANGKVRMCVV